jgi:hypothetical protein
LAIFFVFFWVIVVYSWIEGPNVEECCVEARTSFSGYFIHRCIQRIFSIYVFIFLSLSWSRNKTVGPLFYHIDDKSCWFSISVTGIKNGKTSPNVTYTALHVNVVHLWRVVHLYHPWLLFSWLCSFLNTDISISVLQNYSDSCVSRIELIILKLRITKYSVFYCWIYFCRIVQLFVDLSSNYFLVSHLFYLNSFSFSGVVRVRTTQHNFNIIQLLSTSDFCCKFQKSFK